MFVTSQLIRWAVWNWYIIFGTHVLLFALSTKFNNVHQQEIICVENFAISTRSSQFYFCVLSDGCTPNSLAKL